jgi:hypothetical protein
MSAFAANSLVQTGGSRDAPKWTLVGSHTRHPEHALVHHPGKVVFGDDLNVNAFKGRAQATDLCSEETRCDHRIELGYDVGMDAPDGVNVLVGLSSLATGPVHVLGDGVINERPDDGL